MKRFTTLLISCLALGCARAEPADTTGLVFRAQCFKGDPGAVEVVVQGIPAWFGPPRAFALAGVFPSTDARGHPAIRVAVAPEARAQFEAYTTASASGPVGLFLDRELIAVPSIQPIADGSFSFCNEAGGWTDADRDRWLTRLRIATEG